MQLPKKVFLSLLLLEIGLLFSGISIPFFSNDPALYAAISKRMAQTGDFLNLYVYGVDWLDKPHFPFWMAALSFKIFGISEWAYRLPALLFILLGAFYTYLLARKLYNTNVAQIAVLVLLCSQHLLMSNVDVRAEPYLLAGIIGAVYHFYNFFQRFTLLHLILGAFLAGCAVMTKGIFALMPIGTAIIGHAVFTNQFKQLFQWKWFLAIVLTILFFTPEVYAVYIQFDQHPEKIVFGRKGISGIKWFLWDSQFSRFINSGPITRKKGDLFYYVHTLIWAFAPWCLLFYYVFVKRIVRIIQKRRLEEYLTLSAIVPMLLFFSISKFQLNFYTNILFPFFSILIASLMDKGFSKNERSFYVTVQVFYSALLIAGAIVLNYFLQPNFQWVNYLSIFVLIAIFAWLIIKMKPVVLKWLVISCLSVLYINFYFNLTLYPLMASLKAENRAAVYANKFYPGKQFGVFYNTRNGFEFYSSAPVQRVNMDQWMAGFENQRIYYVDYGIYNELMFRKAPFKILKEFIDYPSESISAKFINSSVRDQHLSKGFLIQQ